MSFTEFENLVERYLDETISRAEEARLLDLIKESPEFKKRFKAKVRLHQTMNKCLAAHKNNQAYLSFAWLQIYVKRMSQVASYACLIALVFVQLRVTLPPEYSGALYHLSAAISDEADDFVDGISTNDMLANSEQDDLSDLGMPELDNTDMGSPMDDADTAEV
ncbi:MAG: hypothetical protein WCJ77_01750 [Opitutae bacterium]